MMKRIISPLVVVALLVCACAKTAQQNVNEVNKRVFDSWLSIHYPDAKKTELGAYVIEDVPGTGESLSDVEKYPYLRMDYTLYDLNGDVQSTTFVKMAQQIGLYTEGKHYAPEIVYRGANGIVAGLEESLSQMRIGGRRKVIIPGWLSTKQRYDTAEEYLQKASGSAAIYYVEPVEAIADIEKWELDSLDSYVTRNFPSVTPKDTLKKGFYYVCTVPSEKPDIKFNKDTTIYINYIGRLLDGTVFDTNIRDSAIFYGIYKPGGSYSPSNVTVKENYTEIKMGDSSIIDGFAYAISKMHPFEKGSAMFYSVYGYGTSGSGNSIPAYSPLRFDLEVVKK